MSVGNAWVCCHSSSLKASRKCPWGIRHPSDTCRFHKKGLLPFGFWKASKDPERLWHTKRPMACPKAFAAVQ